MRIGEPGGVERSPDRGARVHGPERVVDVFDSVRSTAAERVVDHDVEAAVPLDRVGDTALDILGLGDVGHEADCFATAVSDLLGGRFTGLGAASGEDDVRASGREGVGDASPHSLAGAGHDRRPARQRRPALGGHGAIHTPPSTLIVAPVTK